MSLARLALPAAFAALAATAWSSAAAAASVETYRLSNVTDSWQSIGLSASAQGGVLLAQTISEIGWDAGTARINDSFQLRFEECDNGTHDLAEEAAVASFIGSLSDLGVTGETGTFWMTTSGPETTHKIQFQRTYVHPVVLVQAVSSLGSDPVAVVPYVTTGDFALIGMPEGAGYDGIHYANEKIQYVVVEAGTYLLSPGSDGTSQFLEAGIKDVTTTNYSNTGMTDITPSSVLFWDSTTAVIAQPQSTTSAGYRGTRLQRTVDSDGFLSSVSVRHMLDKTLEHPSTGSAPTTTGNIGYIAVGTGFEKTGSLTATANPIYATEITSGVTSELSASSTDVEGTVLQECKVADIAEYLLTSSDSWGGSTFGSSYDVMAGIGSNDGTGHDFWIGAEGSADATIFGHTKEVFSAGAVSYADDGVSSSSAWVDVLGVNLWKSSLSGEITEEYSQTFIEEEGDFYGFTIKGSAVGNVGITAGLSLSGSTFALTGEPYANVQGKASVGVGAFSTDVSIEGTLTLLQLSVPASGTFSLPTSGAPYYFWTYDADLQLTTLDGSLDLIGEVLGAEVFDYELFSWNGLTLYSTNLVSGSGCL